MALGLRVAESYFVRRSCTVPSIVPHLLHEHEGYFWGSSLNTAFEHLPNLKDRISYAEDTEISRVGPSPTHNNHADRCGWLPGIREQLGNDIEQEACESRVAKFSPLRAGP
jgi:hypothetical protein